ncbi:MAG: zinc ribbon domain-containing protein [Anaerolineales bacterium]|jgi:hypothetical protein
MDIGSILIGLALALAVSAYVIRPLVVGGGEKVTDVDRRLSELLAERDRVLSRIQELDMDFAMGKLGEQDYRGQRDELMLYGAGILKELDTKVGLETTSVDSVKMEDEIESAVARLRGIGGSQSPAFCPSCGEAVQQGDRFCTHCGTALITEESGA